MVTVRHCSKEMQSSLVGPSLSSLSSALYPAPLDNKMALLANSGPRLSYRPSEVVTTQSNRFPKTFPWSDLGNLMSYASQIINTDFLASSD